MHESELKLELLELEYTFLDYQKYIRTHYSCRGTYQRPAEGILRDSFLSGNTAVN
jgi:hypothetical protein